MRKRLLLILTLVLLLIAGGWLYLRFDVLKTKDFKPDAAKARTLPDLRSALIAKLQQLVKNGSDSLYALSIDTFDPDVAASMLEAKGVWLRVDSPGYKRLLALKLPPDAVYGIHFDILHVDGIGRGSDTSGSAVCRESPFYESCADERQLFI